MKPQREVSCPDSNGIANPQMALRMEPREKPAISLKYSDIPNWDDLMGRSHFNIGVVIYQSNISDRHVYAISNPASSCDVTSLVVLTPAKEEEGQPASTDGWLDKHNLGDRKKDIDIAWGEAGFEKLLKTDSIDAVYIIVRPG
jgi:hypothetical protein